MKLSKDSWERAFGTFALPNEVNDQEIMERKQREMRQQQWADSIATAAESNEQAKSEEVAEQVSWAEMYKSVPIAPEEPAIVLTVEEQIEKIITDAGMFNKSITLADNVNRLVREFNSMKKQMANIKRTFG